MSLPDSGCPMEIGVATPFLWLQPGLFWLGRREVAIWIFCVATWKSHCVQKRGRDMKLMSRHRIISRRVATWFWCYDLAWDWAREGGCDLRPWPRRYARDLRTLSARPALAVGATGPRPACCARSSAHDLGTARAVCARPGFWVCVLCTQPSFVTVHCLGSLFKRTVHMVKKKEYKIFKNSLMYDLIYKIIILKLL